MLDRDLKASDASIELLEDRKKQLKYIFLFFYITGVVMVMLFWSIGFIDWRIGEMVAITGIGFMIVATWFMLLHLQLSFYLFLINKKLVDAPKERSK